MGGLGPTGATPPPTPGSGCTVASGYTTPLVWAGARGTSRHSLPGHESGVTRSRVLGVPGKGGPAAGHCWGQYCLLTGGETCLALQLWAWDSMQLTLAAQTGRPLLPKIAWEPSPVCFTHHTAPWGSSVPAGHHSTCVSPPWHPAPGFHPCSRSRGSWLWLPAQGGTSTHEDMACPCALAGMNLGDGHRHPPPLHRIVFYIYIIYIY